MNIKIIDDTFYPKNSWSGIISMLILVAICMALSNFLPYIMNIIGWFFIIIGLYGFQKFYFQSKKKKRKKK